MRFYDTLTVSSQMFILNKVYQIVSKREAKESSIILNSDLHIGSKKLNLVYRQYETLYFVFIVDDQESELGILDLIQVFVECLDKIFNDVCELDLVFGWQMLQLILDEMVHNGLVAETSSEKIIKLFSKLENSDCS